MNLLLLFGPLAVGKMTVGQELAKLTGYKLLHNHMTIDLVAQILEFNSPPFWRLVGDLAPDETARRIRNRFQL